MKNWIIAIVILVIGIGIALESRYAMIVDSPIVAKIDRLTGDVWIVNSGIWRKVQMPAPEEKGQEPKAEIPQARSRGR